MFCLLFDMGGDENRSINRTSSVLSLLSNKSRKSNASFKSVRVKYKDFEKF